MVKKARFLAAFFLFLGMSAHGAGLKPDTVLECTSVSLEGLDKITARVLSLDATVKNPVKFQNLTLTVQRCLMTPADEPYEVAAFLEITETNTEIKNAPVFSGWMFASSPSLSTLDHPIYDVWLKHDQKERSALKPPPVETVKADPVQPKEEVAETDTSDEAQEDHSTSEEASEEVND